MPSDPDHVLDAIDGVVEDWETLSADSMRWAPPEDVPVDKAEAQVPDDLFRLPEQLFRSDLFREVTEIFGPLVNTLTEAFRPVGDAVERYFDVLEDDQPRLEVEPADRSCQCLCFRHEDRPGICTGVSTGLMDEIPMCEPCTAMATL